MLKKNLTKLVLAMLFSWPGFSMVFGQDTLHQNRLTWSAYLDVYYAFDADQPLEGNRPPFFYNYHRHNEVNINLALIKLNYQTDRTRSNIGLMAGTYPQVNLASEPALLKYVYEANVGLKLSKTADWWLDAGILPSHIGFESAIGKDNWTLTRSLCAENSPYYEAGLKLGFTSTDQRWQGAVLYLNGWQRVQRLPGQPAPAWGTQLTFKPATNWTFNWSTYAGKEYPDGDPFRRYFSNLYAIWQTDHWGITAGLDGGWQQQKNSTSYAQWFTPILISRYAFSDHVAMSGRWEYYADDQQIIIATPGGAPFRAHGASLNLDISPDEHLTFRLEGRTLWSDQAIHTADGRQYRDNYFVTTALSYRFGK